MRRRSTRAQTCTRSASSLYESLSGKKPFMADTIGDLVYALCSGPATHIGEPAPRSAGRDRRHDHALAQRDQGRAAEEHGRVRGRAAPVRQRAFGLWVRVDGKQPALAGRSGTHPATAAQAPVAAPATAAKPPTSTTAVAPRPPGKSTLPLNVGAAAAASEASRRPAPPVPPTPGANKTMALWTDAALEGGPAPGTGVAIPSPVDETTEGGPRRDTPTEMYKGGGDDGPSNESTGDRDTPTRAIPAPNFDKGRRAVPMPTLKSGPYGDEPTGELPNAIANPLGPPDVALMQTVPASAIPHIPGFEQGASQHQLMGLVSSQPSLVDSPFKPAWQRTLDNLLVNVGRKVDGWIVKFKNAPKNTQILVIACGASVVLFLGVLIFVLVS